MPFDFLEQLSRAFEKRSKAIRHSGAKLTARYEAYPNESLSVDYRMAHGIWIGIYFDADSYVQIAIEQRRINRRLRRLAKLTRLHITPNAETVVATCEKTFGLAYYGNESDEWWRTEGQQTLDSLWLKLGT